MPQQYEAQLTALLRERALTAERIELPGELFFRIRLDRR
jgi:hypothetical protein